MCIIFTVFYNLSIVVNLFHIPSLAVVIYGSLNKLKLKLKYIKEFSDLQKVYKDDTRRTGLMTD